MTERLMTKDEIALWLGLKRRTVTEWGRTGFLPRVMVKVGERYEQFHDQSEVADWLDSKRVSA